LITFFFFKLSLKLTLYFLNLGNFFILWAVFLNSSRFFHSRFLIVTHGFHNSNLSVTICHDFLYFLDDGNRAVSFIAVSLSLHTDFTIAISPCQYVMIFFIFWMTETMGMPNYSLIVFSLVTSMLFALYLCWESVTLEYIKIVHLWRSCIFVGRALDGIFEDSVFDQGSTHLELRNSTSRLSVRWIFLKGVCRRPSDWIYEGSVFDVYLKEHQTENTKVVCSICIFDERASDWINEDCVLDPPSTHLPLHNSTSNEPGGK